MIKAIKSVTDPLARRVKLMIARAVLNAVVEGGARQFVQITILKGEVKDKVERVQQYGFTSSPLAGAQVIVASLGGNRDHPVAISVDDPRYRLKDLEPGEVAVFNNAGAKIVLKADGSIELTAPEKVRMVTPLLEVTGEILDRSDSGGRSLHEMRAIYDDHHHGGSAAPTEQMGG